MARVGETDFCAQFITNWISVLGVIAREHGLRGIALDVGANSGLFCTPLAGHFEKVVALEPNVERARFLERAVPANVEVICAGAGKVRGLASFTVPVRADGAVLHSLGSVAKSDVTEFHGNVIGGLQRKHIAVITIDDLVESIGRPIGLIKIDVEGLEQEVLEGAENSLAAHRPVLFMELETRHGGRPEVTYDYLGERGYECFASDHGKLSPCPTQAAFAEAMHGRDIYNFLFAPRD